MTALLILLAIVLLGWLALYVHHIFEGEWLPHDLWREWRLSHKTLAELDAAWTTVTKSQITITLTTTPSRIHLLPYTLKSLLDQSRPPARILLNVPEFSIREQVAYEIPEVLQNLASVQIQHCGDLGPATKLIPSLTTVAQDQPLLVLDDDRIYPDWLIARYEDACQEHPNIALAMGGWVVPEDLQDRFTTLKTSLLMQPPAPIRAPRLRCAREIDVMLGVFSYLVQPSMFNIDEMHDLSGPEALRYVDDVRTSALCHVPKMVIPAKSLSFVPWAHRKAFQSTRLGLINRGQGGGTRHNTIALQHYKNKWRVGGPQRQPSSPF